MESRLTVSSVLDRKLVTVATTMPTDTQHNHNNPATPPVERPQPNRLHRHPPAAAAAQTRMLPTVATRTTCKCGMQPWRHSNKVVKVKVSNDKAR